VLALSMLAGSGLLAHHVLAAKADETVVQADIQAEPPAAPKPAMTTKDQLTPETFAGVRALIRPNDQELGWRNVRWHTDFWMARQKAAAEDKPILVFWGQDGAGVFDMLGRC